jgi:protein-disulfide isomerase
MTVMRRISVPMALAFALGVVACDELGSELPGSAAVSTAQARQAVGPRTVQAISVGYRLGSPDAPIAVVEFSDFGCPYCGRFAITTFPDLRREYLETGLVRWRYVPVSFGFAGGALMGAASECAGRQAGEDGFWRAHEVLYRHQGALRGEDALDRLLVWLAEEGLDADRLRACIRDPATAAALQANNRVAEEWFVRGTPTFLVNGAPMSGALPTDFFRKVLDTALDPSGL